MDNFNVVCNHKDANMDCTNLTKAHVLRIREKFFENPNKIIQDNMLANAMQIENPKRKRSRKVNGRAHNFTVKYFVGGNENFIYFIFIINFFVFFKVFIENLKHQICQKLFRAIYSVSQRRINTICNKIKMGSGITEQRGGDKRSSKYTEKFNSVKEFIGQLKGKESHYGRSKSRRLYLSSEYTISKLWELYNEKVAIELKVNYKYFSRIFNNNFNIGFGSPATDVCGYCVRTGTQINNADDLNIKSRLKTQLKVHKFRATQFYKLMKEEAPNSMSFCFDLQQVQVLPKVPIQDAFYAQQLSIYFFCITPTNCQDPVFYSWMENQAGRGATETSSALLDFLKNTNFSPNINRLRLFADGCGGQNKNSYIIHMLMLWLYKFAPDTIQKIELIFPVRGHSYLPADRIFGRVEKNLRRYSVIKTPEQYWKLYSNVGKIRKLGTDWSLWNIKMASTYLNKVKGISSCKRIYIKRGKLSTTILVKTELLYRSNDTTKKSETLLKSRKRLDQIEISELPLGHKIKNKKLASLKKLLVSLSGENWHCDPELEWMIPIFNEDGAENSEEENETCECAEEDDNEFT